MLLASIDTTRLLDERVNRETYYLLNFFPSGLT
jgi:hypothetical protein